MEDTENEPVASNTEGRCAYVYQNYRTVGVHNLALVGSGGLLRAVLIEDIFALVELLFRVEFALVQAYDLFARTSKQRLCRPVMLTVSCEKPYAYCTFHQ